MTRHARGTFDVQLAPLATEENVEGTPLGRMSIDKTFHGDVEATSKGEMLTAMSPVKGSGAYVAVERVSGSVGGRKGTFALHHVGVMTRGNPSLSIFVVPDSGTGDLTGLAGTVSIEIKEGKHFYDLAYTLPAAP